MKVYIAGKVTGTSLVECTHKFGTAHIAIQKLGHTAINPLAVVNNWKTTWQAAMKLCIAALMTADAVYVLPCSQDSKGAKLELKIAKELGIPVYNKLNEIPQL